MEDDGKNAMDVYYQELKNKYDEALKKNHDLSEAIVTLKELITNSNEELSRNADEMRYYDNLVRQIQSEHLPTESDAFIDDDEDLDEKGEKLKEEHVNLIHEKLKEVANEIDKKLMEVDMTHEVKNKGENETLFYQSICVILAEGDLMGDTGKFQFKYQTFRNKTNMTFKRLKDICMDLWDLKGSDVKYSIKFIENDAITKIENEDNEYNFIDAFLKNKTNIKKAKFVLVTSNRTNLDSIIEQSEDAKVKNQSENKQNSPSMLMLQNFFTRFVGLSKRMVSKYGEIMEEKIINTSKKDEKMGKGQKGPSKLMISMHIINIISLLLFFSFTMVNLATMRPTEKCYQMQNSFYSIFSGSGTHNYLSSDAFKTDMLAKISKLFIDPKTRVAPLLTSNSLISQVKFSMYKTIEISCVMQNLNQTCYAPLFTTSTADTDGTSQFIINSDYEKTDLFPSNWTQQDYADNFFILSDTYSNFVDNGANSSDNFFTYVADVLNPFTIKNSDNYVVDFTGRLGTYDQNSAVDLFFTPPYINEAVFEKIVDIIEYPDNTFITKGLKSATLDFVIYNNYSGFYFYIWIMYEFPSTGGILPPTVKVIPFLLNPLLKESYIGIFDIIRLIFILMIFCLTLKIFFDEKKLKDEKTSVILFKAFLDSRLITTTLILFLYISCYAIKAIYLTKIPGDIIYSLSNNGYLKMNTYEYYTIVSNYEMVVILDTIIIFCLFFLFLLFSRYFVRFNIFLTYILKCIRSVFVYVLIVILILLCEAIFSNNLWGQNYQEYRDLPASFMNTLLFSIGHYQKQVFENQYQNWNLFYTLLFFLIVIYFILSSFVGIFLEAYRLTCLEHGYAYDYRKGKLDEGKRKRNKLDIY